MTHRLSPADEHRSAQFHLARARSAGEDVKSEAQARASARFRAKISLFSRENFSISFRPKDFLQEKTGHKNFFPRGLGAVSLTRRGVNSASSARSARSQTPNLTRNRSYIGSVLLCLLLASGGGNPKIGSRHCRVRFGSFFRYLAVSAVSIKVRPVLRSSLAVPISRTGVFGLFLIRPYR